MTASDIPRIARIQERIQPLREQLLDHPVYVRIGSLEALQVFMEHHVFAVWDFMSLLKALQQRFTCLSIPWIPPANRLACRLVNEIVLAEESDEDKQGGVASHFDLYHASMRQCGADTQAVHQLLEALQAGHGREEALGMAGIPEAARQFLEHTFEVIDSGDAAAIASAFTFGREDLLPDVFQQIVNELASQSDGPLDGFRYYLARHIELDGDEHGPLAHRLVESLCGSDEARWRAAEEAAVASLRSRLRLWDGIEASLQSLAGSR